MTPSHVAAVLKLDEVAAIAAVPFEQRPMAEPPPQGRPGARAAAGAQPTKPRALRRVL